MTTVSTDDSGIKYRHLKTPSDAAIAVPSTLALPKRAKRMVNRDDGLSQIKHPGVSRRGCLGKIKDGVTTLMDARWYFVLLLFCALYIISWNVFAVAWFAVEKMNNVAFNQTCVENGGTLPAILLFSIETQVTIGYGFKFVRTECVIGIPLLMIQCLAGLYLDSCVLGLVFAKLTRPRQRRKTIVFSDIAVIREVNGEKVLEFRVINLRRSQLVEAHVRLCLYWYEENQAGEQVLECYNLDVGYDTGKDRVLLMTPVIVIHCINESSPLYRLDSESILDQDLEIVVVLEAIVESTGLTVQALWSYTEREILFGHAFVPIIYRQPVTSEWVINCKKINNTISV